MSNSSRLALPYLAAGQAQKHVTVNESLARLDALVQLSARSDSTSAQPGSPTDGDIYILPSGKTGAAWGAMANGALAYYHDGAWEELTPKQGWRVYIEDSKASLVRDTSAWRATAGDGERRFLFTPGGTGAVTLYRIDTTRVQNPRTATISAISTDTITLTTSDAGLFFNDTPMKNVSYVRVWNTSKTPAQSAWLKAQPAANQLKVVDAAALSGWTNGETLQLGDPTSVTPGRVIALDISPMMTNVLGRVFRQAGIVLSGISQGLSVQATLDASETGTSGSFQGVKSFSDGALNAGQFMLPCSVLSPISNSNLLFLRETVSGSAMAIAGATSVGLWT